MCDRLIELLREVERKYLTNGTNIPQMAEFIADYLLENGVIVAPMPMADWLREELTEYVRKRCVEEL